MHDTEEGWQGAPILESRGEPPCRRWRVVQRHVLYHGEINPTGATVDRNAQERQWRRTVEVFTEGEDAPKTLSLFPEDYAPVDDEEVVRLRLKDLSVRRPRQWGACWLACHLYEQLGMDRFWESHLPQSRKGTPWAKVLQELVLYRLGGDLVFT